MLLILYIGVQRADTELEIAFCSEVVTSLLDEWRMNEYVPMFRWNFK